MLPGAVSITQLFLVLTFPIFSDRTVMNEHGSKALDFPNKPSKTHHVQVILPSEKTDSSEAEKANLNFWRIVSAVFYGLSSFLVIVVNKIVLTNYK